MLEDLRNINDADFRAVIGRRLFTIRKRLRTRHQAEDYPEHDDILIRELNALRSIARLRGMRKP